MQVDKNQVEAIRYQLKKIGQAASNNEMRKAAEQFDTFDALAISQAVIKNRSNSLETVNQVSNLQPNQNALTTTQKSELVSMQAGFMGIELSQLEVQNIVNKTDETITDNIEFLREVQQLIKDFLAVRNEQFQKHTNQIVEDIAGVIRDGEVELAQIMTGTNERLRDIVDQCKQAKMEYRSPYKSRLEGIREMLKISV